MKTKQRCGWCVGDELYEAYHDKEWGVPVHDDRLLFEMICLEGAQAGLSWITVLRKRKRYQDVFFNFDAEKISKMTAEDVDRLMLDAGIIRHRGKIEGFIKNAQVFLHIKKEFGSFDAYIWQFVGGKPIKNKVKDVKVAQSKTQESDAMSKDLKKRGFKFVGTTICYAFMQAVGMVNDHEKSCFRY